MSKQRKTVASTYLYDPLDRLATSNSIQRFYNDTRIATEIEGERKSRFFETDSQPLALQQHGNLPGTTLLATDQQTSVLNGVSPEGALHAQAYTPFGHHPIGASLNGAGFNGERPEPVTGHYLLGQGYRAFNPVLMRFNSPDSWSPFGEGGINAYAYCDNDPVMKQDPTGHLALLLKAILRPLGIIDSFAKTTKKLNLQHSSLLNTIARNTPDGTTPISPTIEMLNQSKKTLLKKSNTALNKGLEKIKQSESIMSKIGTKQPELNVLNNNRLKRARGTKANPIERGLSNNQKNIDIQRQQRAYELSSEGTKLLQQSDQYFQALLASRAIRTS